MSRILSKSPVVPLSALLGALLLCLWVLRIPTRAVEDPDAAALLLEGLLNCAETVDLSATALPASDLGRIYADLLHSHPELFHVAPRLSYTSREGKADGVPLRLVAAVYPTYTLTGAVLTAARALYRDTLTVILAEMDGAFGETPPSEAEMVLYLHDLLAHRYAYDTRADAPNADAYRFFRDGMGICQAYALAFLALARAAGLEADLVASDAMDHAWNHVRVDGVWYHVDITRDDPIPAAEGREQVNHTRLLRTDEGMDALGYHGYTCAAGHTCTDPRYEPDGRAALGDFHTPVVLFGTAWMATEEDGAPVAVEVGELEISTGKRGDTDQSGDITPADLLTVYGAEYPEAWREWLRGELTGGT